MAIYNAVNACAHLSNVVKARLGMTSLPSTKVNLAFALALHRAGFISSVHRGGPHPPTPEDFAAGLADQPQATHADAATRRLWLGLKYWNNAPVLSKLENVHRPKRPVHIKLPDLNRIVRGFPSKDGKVKGLRLGECAFIMTDKGLLEAREALARNLGGMVIFRAR